MTESNVSVLAATASYKAREYRFASVDGHPLADGWLSLKVFRGKQLLDTTYALQYDRDEFGRLVTVYLAKERSEDGEVYGVEIGPRGQYRCSCLGFARHGQCKHADAIRDLLEAGRDGIVPVRA